MNDRVLIVDDDETIAKLLEDLVRQEVSEVRIARSGHEAIELIDSQAFGLIFLDLRMPGGDGHSVVRHLIETRPTPKPTVLVLSAVADDNTRLDESVVTAVIRKPFDPHNIGAIVSRYIARAGSEVH